MIFVSDICIGPTWLKITLKRILRGFFCRKKHICKSQKYQQQKKLNILVS